ncbi:MAG: hypothetical protein Q4D32_01400 [Eubacteriales bacterium]|nr:hypothetical protein [Eubacteriales bacterium]
MRDYDKEEPLQQQIREEIDFDKLNDFCEHLTDAIQEIFHSCGLYFRIFSRVKSVESIAGKIIRRQYGTEKNPKKLQDLVGIRVVLYYYDDLSICRDIMESTFQMIDHWSRTNNNANEFKATKINGVFRFPAEYFSLYKKELWDLPIDTTFEIQFRTVFFEGWHEIEHDMRYKSLLSDDEFWKGSEELSRILNCVLANLELSDWSLVQLFDQLSYNHYKNANWELMLKSKFRIRMDDNSVLHPDIIALFDRDKDVSKQFFKCSRKDLIRELLKLDTPHLNYNLIVKLLNDRSVHNEEITAICASLPALKEERSYQKTIYRRLDSSVLFHLELPLLHKETRTLESEFANGAYVLYKWARFKFNSVFNDIPTDLCSYHNKLPGYQIRFDYQPEKMTFTMKIHYIDSQSVGTLWHVHSSIALLDDGRLHFYHMTSRDMPHGIAQRATFVKPSFLSDLSSKVGLTDGARLSTKAHFVTEAEELQQFYHLIEDPARRLPLIAILQQFVNHNAENDSNYPDGYDMNTFTINGMRLAKVIGLYSHVYMLDQDWTADFATHYGFDSENMEGAICIFWPPYQKRNPEMYTHEMICDTEFDFNRLAFHDQNISEKAFRHKLVQMMKDENAMH